MSSPSKPTNCLGSRTSSWLGRVPTTDMMQPLPSVSVPWFETLCLWMLQYNPCSSWKPHWGCAVCDWLWLWRGGLPCLQQVQQRLQDPDVWSRVWRPVPGRHVWAAPGQGIHHCGGSGETAVSLIYHAITSLTFIIASYFQGFLGDAWTGPQILAHHLLLMLTSDLPDQVSTITLEVYTSIMLWICSRWRPAPTPTACCTRSCTPGSSGWTSAWWTSSTGAGSATGPAWPTSDPSAIVLSSVVIVSMFHLFYVCNFYTDMLLCSIKY